MAWDVLREMILDYARVYLKYEEYQRPEVNIPDWAKEATKKDLETKEKLLKLFLEKEYAKSE